jgi:hypothetical protein
MITLAFPLAGVVLLAEHALAATAHEPSTHDVLHATKPAPALWLIGGSGVFLMSNGIDTACDEGSVGGLLVVYAEGYRTRADWLKAAVDAGRADDIRIVFPLLDAGPGQTNLHEALTAGAAAGVTELVIDLWAHKARWRVPAAGNGQGTR